MDILTKEKMFVWSMRINLRLIVKFHYECNRLMRNQIFDINEEIRSCKDEKVKNILIVERGNFAKTFLDTLQSNTFLMMYSYLEEFLYCLRGIYSSETELEDKGSIKRFKPIFVNCLEMDLEKDPDWQFICDCEKIRDCLLHANGRVDLSKDKEYLEKIVFCSNDLLRIDLKRIVITDGFLQEVNKVLYSFLTKVISRETI